VGSAGTGLGCWSDFSFLAAIGEHLKLPCSGGKWRPRLSAKCQQTLKTVS
jgi:hypothetical protein